MLVRATIVRRLLVAFQQHSPERILILARRFASGSLFQTALLLPQIISRFFERRDQDFLV